MPTLLSLALFIAATSHGLSQIPPTDKPLPPRFGSMVRSPEVHPDGRVTFRFRAPHAKQVGLARSGMRGVAMQKDDSGVWSVTTAPLPPGFYDYRFAVDGVSLIDPANPLLATKVMGNHESIVHVPGPASLSWERSDVPRGTLHRHSYLSKVVGEEREFTVYTPPGYDPVGDKKYPVLYLLHGVTDDATAWTTVGRAHVILDNLIAQGKAKPMLMVFPFGYGFPNVPDRVGELFQAGIDQKKLMDAFAVTLLDEVIPQVERAYRVTADREARAIAGLSMGGSQALYIGLNHADRFAWVGSFSGAFVMYGGQFSKWFPHADAIGRPPTRLLWIGCGTEDFLFGANRAGKDWLKSKSVTFTAVETPGGHVWHVWRRNLTEFAPLLFREKAE
jgi:enterochelin esterase-like enzyme